MCSPCRSKTDTVNADIAFSKYFEKHVFRNDAAKIFVDRNDYDCYWLKVYSCSRCAESLVAENKIFHIKHLCIYYLKQYNLRVDGHQFPGACNITARTRIVEYDRDN